MKCQLKEMRLNMNSEIDNVTTWTHICPNKEFFKICACYFLSNLYLFTQ